MLPTAPPRRRKIARLPAATKSLVRARHGTTSVLARTRGRTTQSIFSRHQFALWVGACIAACLVLRLPFASVPLGIDEGGLALLAGQWAERSGSMYGGYWLDRSPVLLGIYQVAVLGGEAGVRAVGALAAVALVALVAVTTRTLGGETAGRIAAALMALLMASPAIHAVFTPAELLAAVPSAAAVALLVAAAHRRAERTLLLFGAGTLATSALLIKQSFICATAAVLAYAVVLWVRRRDDAGAAHGVAAILGGLCVPVILVEAWAASFGPGISEFNYALLGFRLDALGALQQSHTPLAERVVRLAGPFVESGLVLPALAAPIALRTLRHRGSSLLFVVLAAWFVGAVVGVLFGGYYWRHYLIQVTPPVVVLGALGLATLRPRVTTTAIVVMAAVACVTSLGATIYLERWPYQADVKAVVRVLDSERRPSDTIQVLYSRANLVYYSGMQSPSAYQWSSMFRVMPRAEQQLRRQLASPDRPTWVVAWQRPTSFGLDESGETRALLKAHYRRVARVCGHPVYVRAERDTPSAAEVAASVSCRSAGTSLSQVMARVV